MLELIIVIVVVAVFVLSTATYLVAGRIRGTRTELREAAPPAPSRADRGTEERPPAGAPETASVATKPPQESPAGPAVPEEHAVPEEAFQVPPEAPRFRSRLGRARGLFSGYLGAIRSRDRIDGASWEELEEALLLADVGTEVTSQILESLRTKVKEDGLRSPDELVEALKAELVGRLRGATSLKLDEGETNVWLLVGVNGVGKTTTVAKLALREKSEGRSVVIAAADTFRAAAADQLEVWAEKLDADLIKGGEGADPGAVVFDAVQHAAARKADLVLADTAGRLHTKVNLMEELKKVHRVASRPPGHVTEVLLVLDATTGQNGLVQARQFSAAIELTGVVLTKLDGTAKGGITVAICSELGVPIKLAGLGEGPSDLVEFDPEQFVDALVGSE